MYITSVMLSISVFNYCIGCFLNNNIRQNSRLYTLVNKCAHKILGFQSYRNSSAKNLKECNWISYNQMLIMGGIKLFHKVILTHKPRAITQYIKQSMISVDNSRMVRQSFIERGSKSTKQAIHFSTG